MKADPLRESAHRLLVAAHLREGNTSEAAREYAAFRKLAFEELGVGPSSRMEALIEPIRPAVARQA